MEEITSLDQLLEKLHNCFDVDDFVEVANNIYLEKEEIEQFAFFSGEKYTRNCIERTDEFELMLLCWEKDQKTSIHCHDGEDCWVYIVDGKMVETRFDYNEFDELIKTDEDEVEAGDISFMNDDLGFHELANVEEGRSISLHLYANPIRKCRSYNKSKKGFEVNRLSDFSFKGKLL